MVADRWRMCPKCKKENDKAKKIWREKIIKSYGKVSFEKYRELENELQHLKEEQENRDVSLREDFAFHMDIDGCFSAIYIASCKVCGFHFKFEHGEDVDL